MNPYYDVIKWHFTSMVFSPKTHNSGLIMRKISDKSHLDDNPQNTGPTLIKTSKSSKTSKALRNHHSQEKSETDDY